MFKNPKILFSIYSFASILQSALGIVIGPLVLKKIGLESFGQYGVAISVSVFFSALFDSGLSTHMVAQSSKPLPLFKNSVYNYIKIKLIIFIFGITSYLIYIFTFAHLDIIKIIASILILSVLINPIHIEWLFLGSKNYISLIYSKALFLSLYIFFTCIWYFSSLGVKTLSLPQLIGTIASFIFLLFRSKIPFPLLLAEFWEKTHFRAELKTIAPLALCGLLLPFLLYSGLFLLENNTINFALIGAYNIPQRIIIAWIALSNPFIFYLIPRISSTMRISFRKSFNHAIFFSIFSLISGLVILKLYYFISPKHLEWYPYSKHTYLILTLVILFNTLKIPYSGFLLKNSHYLFYLLATLVSILPILLLLLFKVTVALPLIPYVACIPDCIGMLLFVFYYYFLHKKGMI